MKFIVYGCGKTGLSLAAFLLRRSCQIMVYDDNEFSLEGVVLKLGISPDSIVEKKSFKWGVDDVLIVSPGISKLDNSKWLINSANGVGVTICSSLDIFNKFFAESVKIGITGTCGKSTTTILLYHIMKELRMDVSYGGNIGIPYFEISPIDSKYKVLELSSYELENSISNSLKFLLLTNFHKHHIEHHKTIKRYAAAKLNIIDDACTVFLNADDGGIKKYIIPAIKEKRGNVFFENNVKFFSSKKKLSSGTSLVKNKVFQNGVFLSEIEIPPYLQSEHNRSNLIASIMVAMHQSHFSLPKLSSILKTFKGLPHRSEMIGCKDGIFVVNDSKATSFFAMETCLKSIKSNICLIAGGKCGEEIEPWHMPIALQKRVRKIFLMGEVSEREDGVILADNDKLHKSGTMEQAFIDALSFISSVRRDSGEEFFIVLSPGFQSFDRFNNFEHRGEVFAKFAREEFLNK